MDKINLVKEANAVQNIVSTKRIKINHIELDISNEIDKTQSNIYRRNNIDNIDVSKENKSDKQCKFTVLADGSDCVVFNSRYTDTKLCVLNFASSKNPGGGFIRGAMAQEEAICQASNLYSELSKYMNYYEYNRSHLNKGMYTDGVIFTKDCVFFRNKFKNCNLKIADKITCAAPNFKAARRNGASVEEINNTMRRRLEHILKVAIDNNVRVLALGAFGCGVFHNDIEFVASTIKSLLIDEGYKEYFDEIVFPMNETSGKNVATFLKYFKNIK